MAQGGYDMVTAGEADYRAVLKDEAEAILLEQENRRSEQESTAESLIREYEGRLKDDPENLKLIRSLAELYNRKKEFDKSIEYYELFNKRTFAPTQRWIEPSSTPSCAGTITRLSP